MNKKQLILKAFEKLDAPMLAVLLNDEQSYQDVTKDAYVNGIQNYFDSVKECPETILDFKSYPGKCTLCQKGKTGYAFVNSEGECFMSMVFEEKNDDFTDFYRCSSFEPDDVEIINEWVGLSFYPDEEVGFIHTLDTLKDEKDCLQGMSELQNEIAENGILESGFYSSWYNNYKHLHSVDRIFDKRMYAFGTEIRQHLSEVSSVLVQNKKNKEAQVFLKELFSFEIVSQDSIADWLVRCDVHFPYAKYGFTQNCNFRQNFFEGRFHKFLLSEIYDYQNICMILANYLHWLPESSDDVSLNKAGDRYEDDDDFPF